MNQAIATRCRLNLSQEGLLWKVALAHLGASGLHQTVVDLLRGFGPKPTRSSMEYHSTRMGGRGRSTRVRKIFCGSRNGNAIA